MRASQKTLRTLAAKATQRLGILMLEGPLVFRSLAGARTWAVSEEATVDRRTITFLPMERVPTWMTHAIGIPIEAYPYSCPDKGGSRRARSCPLPDPATRPRVQP